MDGVFYFSIDWTSFVNWIADDVHDSTQCLWTHWDTDWGACVDDVLTSDQTLG